MAPSRFRQRLPDLPTDPRSRRWVYVPYDQLNDRIGPLSWGEPQETGVVLVESRAKASRRPYHKQKLAFILANMRHFALEQAARGVAVLYVTGAGDYAELLRGACDEVGPLVMMDPAERELRMDLASLVDEGLVEIVEHEGWLTPRATFERAMRGKKTWRMDTFYRHVRKTTGILMTDGKPTGGKLSFDAENRQPWRGTPPAAVPPRFEVDPITEEVAELVQTEFADHPGVLDVAALPVTARHAARWWAWTREACLERFGPYEDAMSTQSTNLFHTRIAPLLNVHRLLPREVVADVTQMELPIASQEGFIRQVLGWREFVRHVHEVTDGFRDLSTAPGARVGRNVLDAKGALPGAFWGAPSGLRCLDTVVEDVWREAYSHHITRLMVLGNLTTLLGIDPSEVSDWFWAAYIDAFEWVVEPNVWGMATFGLGELFATKPYVCGASYIARMSDYCGDCAFSPKTNCPITPMYWNFLNAHREVLTANPRMGLALKNAARRSPEVQARDHAVTQTIRARLDSGKPVTPSDL